LFFDETKDPVTAAKRIERLFKNSQSVLETKTYLTNHHSLSQDMINALANRILCPAFQLPAISPSERSALRFSRLLEFQKTILDFLAEQKVAIINGPAGSGKTFIALEKARRLGEQGEKVLFLCFNRLLKEHLERTYTPDAGYDNITFIHIAGFASQVYREYPGCLKKHNDYSGLHRWIYETDAFEYKHIIIDEGQDFAQIEDNLSANGESILQALYDRTVSNDGFLYVFYDKTQMVQAFGHLPKFIKDAGGRGTGCKIVLNRNCRNTFEVTECLEKTIEIGYKYKTRQPASNIYPLMHFEITKADAQIKLRKIISEYKNSSASPDKIVILTMKSAENLKNPSKSCIGGYVNDDTFEGTPVHTFRQFKGLEAECIIIVDMDFEYIKEVRDKRFRKDLYVASSRARSCLHVITDLSNDQCNELLNAYNLKSDSEINEEPANKKFANALGFKTE
jgi:KaiC/GvpD/RAD55 family RecA-like ATPase